MAHLELLCGDVALGNGRRAAAKNASAEYLAGDGRSKIQRWHDPGGMEAVRRRGRLVLNGNKALAQRHCADWVFSPAPSPAAVGDD
jgi:hypothetical protein